MFEINDEERIKVRHKNEAVSKTWMRFLFHTMDVWQSMGTAIRCKRNDITCDFSGILCWNVIIGRCKRNGLRGLLWQKSLWLQRCSVDWLYASRYWLSESKIHASVWMILA